MKLVAGLLDRAMARAGIESDYRLAKVIGITHSAISAYRVGKSLPKDQVIAQLCALSGDDPHLIVAQIQAARASSPEAKNLWMTMAKRLAGGASTAILSVLVAIGLIAAPADSARAGTPRADQLSDSTVYTSYQAAMVAAGAFVLVRLRQFLVLWRLCLAAG